MVFEIIWTERATRDFENTIDFLVENWSEKTAKDYADKIDKVLHIISRMPFLYPKISRKKNVRKCLVVKQNAMYFRVKKRTITILTIFDTRQNPKKLKI
jgi:plasmid stabilization system protein ParE